MFDRVWELGGTRMNRAEYHADADHVEEGLSGIVWKLERAQFVRELDDSAWDAFVAGDWDRVLEIYESERADVRSVVESEAAQEREFRRLRIVESPPGPYLRWELPSLKIFAECGRPARVLDADDAEDDRSAHPLPELMIYGDRALYHVQYDQDLAPCGALKISDPMVIREAAEAVEELYARAEPLIDYFDREIAPLGPPRYES